MAYRSWLPYSALIDACALRAVDGAVAAWSAAWFERGDSAVRRADTPTPGTPPASPRYAAPGVAIDIADRGRAMFVDEALARGSRASRPTPRDREILDDFARRLFEDLAHRLGKAFPREGNAVEGADGLCATWQLQNGERLASFRIAVDASLLIDFRKTQAVLSKRPECLIARLDIAEAVAAEVAVDLGRARLSLSQLSGLELGDVLVLDRTVEEGAQLVAAPCGKELGRARMIEDGNRLRLLVES